MQALTIALGNYGVTKPIKAAGANIGRLNLDFVDGVADGLGCDDLRVTLEPSPGRCCVSTRRES